MDSNPAHRYERPADHPVIIQILTWFLLTASVLAYFARLATKLLVKKNLFEQDDYWITVSVAFAICQSAMIALAAINGLGDSSNQRTAAEIATIEKWQYASEILLPFTVCFARVSYLSLVRVMTPREDHRVRIFLGMVLVVSWAAVNVLVSAFQCHVPATWDYIHGQCIDRYAWFIVRDVLNVVVDAVLIMLPTIFILSLQAGQTTRKIEAVTYFWIRLLAMAAAVADAVSWSNVRDSPDPIQDVWPVVITAQIFQAFSILTTCALYLKPFMKMLQSGFLRIDDTQRRSSTKHSPGSRGNSAILSYIRRTRRKSRQRETLHFRPGQTLGTLNEITAEPTENHTWDHESQSSAAHFIVEQRTWAVESSPRETVTASTRADGPPQEQPVDYRLRPDLS